LDCACFGAQFKVSTQDEGLKERAANMAVGSAQDLCFIVHATGDYVGHVGPTTRAWCLPLRVCAKLAGAMQRILAEHVVRAAAEADRRPFVRKIQRTTRPRHGDRNLTPLLFARSERQESFQRFSLPDHRTCIFRGFPVRVGPASAPL
jgi:hypothetical protein